MLVAVEDVRRGKPDPEGFLAAARRLGAPPARCVVFEDAAAGLMAAAAAGMTAVAIVPGAGPAPGPAWITAPDHRATTVSVVDDGLLVSIALRSARAGG